MIEVELERMAHGGVVVGRFDDKVILVTGGLPGERVVVEIIGRDNRLDRRRVIQVLEASPEWVEPPCPVVGKCGGCDWQYANPELQLDLKMVVVTERLSRLMGIAWPGRVEAIQPMVSWRTQMRYSVSGGRMGLRGWRSHEVAPLPETGCLTTAPGLFPAQLDELAEGAESPSAARAANGVSVLTNRKPLAGPPRIREKTGKLSFQVAAPGFWQVHPRAAETLLDVVMEGLRPGQGDLAFDLYCGPGLFAAGPDYSRTEVSGAELNREAAANARVNVPRGHFLALPLAKALRRLPSGVDLVVPDPPRRGAGATVVAHVVDLASRVVACVAYDPANLIKDLASFAVHGYETNRIRAFDLLPIVRHVECVAILKPVTKT